MTKTIRLVIVDDHAIFRLGLVQSLAPEPAIEVVGQGGSVAEAVVLAGKHRPDLLLLDLWMQRRNSSRELGIIQAASPTTKIVVLTASEASQDVVTAMSSGASGYVSKDTAPDELIGIIQQIHRGETYLSSQSLASWLAAFRETAKIETERTLAADLSQQELAVLRAIADGSNNKEAATRLGITAATIKYHLARIFVKLGVRNRVEAAVLAKKLLDDH